MPVRKFIEELQSGNRRVADNWAIVAFSLYGSILADLPLCAAAEHGRETPADTQAPKRAEAER